PLPEGEGPPAPLRAPGAAPTFPSGRVGAKRRVRLSLLAVLTVIDIATMATQEIHEPFVVGFGKVEQLQGLAITAACPFESSTDHMLDVTASDLPFRIRLRDRLPKIFYAQFAFNCCGDDVIWENDVTRLDNISFGRIHSSFNDILKFTNVARKAVRLEF